MTTKNLYFFSSLSLKMNFKNNNFDLDFEFYSNLTETVCLNNITTHIIEHIANRTNPRKFIFYKDNIEYSDYEYTDTDLGPQSEYDNENETDSLSSIQTVQDSSALVVNNIRNISYLKRKKIA